MELMSSPEQFDWNNKFAPSILATYLGCSSIIAAVETLFDKEEQLSGRFLCFWFNAFSAFVSVFYALILLPNNFFISSCMLLSRFSYPENLRVLWLHAR